MSASIARVTGLFCSQRFGIGSGELAWGPGESEAQPLTGALPL